MTVLELGLVLLVTVVLVIALVKARRMMRREWMETPVEDGVVLVHEARHAVDPDTLDQAVEAVRIARERAGRTRT